jgi:hypothetical protein
MWIRLLLESLMFPAVGSPGYRAKSLLFDRATIDEALAEGSLFDSFQRVSHLVEGRQVDIPFLKLSTFFFVSDTRIAPVTRRRSVAQIACVCVCAIDILQETLFFRQQSLLVFFFVQDCRHGSPHPLVSAFLYCPSRGNVRKSSGTGR